MLPDAPCKHGFILWVDGDPTHFSLVCDRIKVSEHTLGTAFESHENSWGTTVILQTRGASASKEICLTTSSPLLQG